MQGSDMFAVPRLGRLRIVADGPFRLYGSVTRESEIVPLGPSSRDQRDFKMSIPRDFNFVHLRTGKNVRWTASVVDQCGKDPADPNPIEIPIDMTRPMNFEDAVRRAVAFELSVRAEREGIESFEESDDFEVEEDLHEVVELSQYQMFEDEYPIQGGEREEGASLEDGPSSEDPPKDPPKDPPQEVLDKEPSAA